MPSRVEEVGLRRRQVPPTADQVKAECRRFAWRFHGVCGGRGYRIENGEPKVCPCALKRMRRHLVQRGELEPDPRSTPHRRPQP